MRRSLLLFVVSTVLALALVEGALRLMRPRWAIPYPPYCYRPDLFERWDPYGYRLHPSRTLRDVYPFPGGREITIHANADGFRSPRELSEDDPRPRVLVLGDSMVFGSGVEEPERLTERLEARIPAWRIDNAAMVGFGPDLMLRALDAVGLATQPSVVLVVLFSHDLYRVAPEASGVGFALPRFTLEDGDLLTVPYPVRPRWMRLYLVQGARYLWFRYTDTTFALNAAILERVRVLGARHDFVPAVVFAPGPSQRFDDRMRQRWLARWSATAGVAYLDLSGPLAAAGGEKLYIPGDAHWNAEGHAAVADALEPFLRRLVPPSRAFAQLTSQVTSDDRPSPSRRLP